MDQIKNFDETLLHKSFGKSLQSAIINLKVIFKNWEAILITERIKQNWVCNHVHLLCVK